MNVTDCPGEEEREWRRGLGGLWLIDLNVPLGVWIQGSTEARRVIFGILQSDIRDPFEASCVFAVHRGPKTVKR